MVVPPFPFMERLTEEDRPMLFVLEQREDRRCLACLHVMPHHPQSWVSSDTEHAVSRRDAPQLVLLRTSCHHRQALIDLTAMTISPSLAGVILPRHRLDSDEKGNSGDSGKDNQRRRDGDFGVTVKTPQVEVVTALENLFVKGSTKVIEEDFARAAMVFNNVVILGERGGGDWRKMMA
ncbi:hypothetical protein PIB30_044239 [Stylosanthes scabra]|uniref:Uncharacterized protein n=1 Tax=Stylosanthes scabra TaxID=79078 RepID=A0ABU6XDW5_9FABA|nr:hypothetical protein [Stylosanthes scabra]